MTEYKLLIDGALTEGDASEPVVNPATGDLLAHAPRASVAQLHEAVKAANTAFPQWSAAEWNVRAQALNDLADAIEENQDELSRLLTAEQGKPLAESQAEVGACSLFLRYFAAQTLKDEVIEDSDEVHVVKIRRPLGVVAAIIPWNFPLLILCAKIGPALVTGNTVVAKPSPTTPLSSLRIGELAQGIFPKGVLNLIADRNDLGSEMSAHPDIRKVSFTGSTETGKKVMAGAANSVKRLTLELGGNDAAIVLDDVDVGAIAPAIFQFAMFNNGQTCIAIKRVYVQESIYERMVAALSDIAGSAAVGDGSEPGTQIGPLHNKAQFEKTLAYLTELKAQNKITVGGETLGDHGYFIRPAVVRDVTNGERIVDEEQFGPILPLVKVADEEEAIRLANDSQYGLGGSVWSSDFYRAMRVASRLNTGTVWVNKHLDFRPDAPVAGAKYSGVGVEFSVGALEESTQVHVINAAR